MRKRNAERSAIEFEDALSPLDLSPWTGVSPLAAMPDNSGELRAAEVVELARIRDHRLYFNFTATWEEFCENYLHLTRRSVDRAIRRLREFGAVFFRAAEAIQLTSREYRAIRGHISSEGVRFQRGTIPFAAANRERITDALTELLQRSGAKSLKVRGEVFARMTARLEASVRMLEHYSRPLDRTQKFELSALEARIVRRSREMGVRTV